MTIQLYFQKTLSAILQKCFYAYEKRNNKKTRIYNLTELKHLLAINDLFELFE